jgi:hypothetical protein
MGKFVSVIKFAVETVRFLYEFVSTIHYSVELFKDFHLAEHLYHLLMLIPHHIIVVLF